MNAPSFSTTNRTDGVFLRLIGGVAVITGLMVLAGWLLGVQALTSLIPGAVTMKANTALCFVLSGAAIVLLQRSGLWALGAARVCAVAVGGVALLTFAQYATSRDFGIDQLLVRDTGATVGTSHPGRMGQNTTVCFLLMSGALWLMSRPVAIGYRPFVFGWLGALVFGIGLFAVLGYLAEFISGQGWWSLTGMAVHTASLFVILGVAVLNAAWHGAGHRWFISPWLTAGFAFGLALLVAVAAYGYRSTQELVAANTRVAHTQEVIGRMTELRMRLEEAQSALRGYVITGNEEFLALAVKADPAARRAVRELLGLTINDARTRERIVAMERQIIERLDFSQHVIGRRRDAGFEEAARLIATGRGENLMNKIRSELGDLKEANAGLLVSHEAQAGAIAERTLSALPAGVLLSALLLALGFLRLNREVAARQGGAETLEWEKSAFELISRAASLREVLDGLMLGLEKRSPGAHCSILLMDDDGIHLRHGAAPSLPEEYNRLIDGIAIGPAVGSCGTAAHEKRQVIVTDIARDPLWANYRELALQHGLRSCWSTPIPGEDGKLLGTFAVYYGEPRHPDAASLELIARAVYIARIAIERKQTDEEIRKLNIGLEERVERRTAQLKAANASLTDFKTALDEHAIVAITDPSGRITFVNDKFCAISKYSREELIGQDHRIINSGYHSKDFIRALWTTISRGDVWKGEIKNRAKDGTIYWVDTTIVPFLKPDGKPAQYMAIRTDVTERRHGEEALRVVKDRLAAATSAARVGIWDYDVEHNCLVWDEEMYRLYGITAESFSGAYEAWEAGLHPEDLLGEREKVQMALKGAKDFDTEFRVLWPDKTVHYIKAKAVVQRDDSGKPVRMIGTNWDVTVRKELEEKLQRTADELQKSNIELEQFAYIASHDLQEPLRMVVSYLTLIERRYKDRLDAEGVEFLKFAVDGGQRMQGLIRDLLAFSRIGTQKKPFQPVDLDGLLKSVMGDLQVAITEGGVTVTHDAMPTVRGDATQLRQLFQNLVSNGMKFRGKEAPMIHVSAERCDGEWRFGVRDNGIGIDPQYFERIFVIFQRLHGRDEYPGTGIGLAVCKKIVERHGGRIWVESEPGKGTTFYFTLADSVSERG